MHLPVEKSLEVAAVCVPASQHFPYRDKGCTVQVFFFSQGVSVSNANTQMTQMWATHLSTISTQILGEVENPNIFWILFIQRHKT